MTKTPTKKLTLPEKELCRNGHKLAAIREVRNRLRLSLHESLDLVDAYVVTLKPKVAPKVVKKGCAMDTDGDGNCMVHPQGCWALNDITCNGTEIVEVEVTRSPLGWPIVYVHVDGKTILRLCRANVAKVSDRRR